MKKHSKQRSISLQNESIKTRSKMFSFFFLFEEKINKQYEKLCNVEDFLLPS